MNTNTIKLSSEEANAVKEYLNSLGAEFDVVQYSLWRAKTNNLQAIYYTSGKLLLQGSDVKEFSEKIGEITGKETVHKAEISFDDVYIGTDESGKGDYFGPLVIAGVQVNKETAKMFMDLGIQDSKKLNDSVIEKLAVQIKNNAPHSIVVILPKKYNELYENCKNLNKLLAWGHARAIENILEKSPCKFALSDKFGDEKLIQNALMKKGKEITLEQRVRGEADIAVAAASIIARASFVRRMRELEETYKIELPKGANREVIKQAKLFCEKYSKDELKNIAKLHFKTTQMI
ncbi:ribonuclease HIII [bacterium]|nr:ribonuclease HIII [bacterium]